jgi:glycosyltransferase involved in cell wall biosynthesis
MFSESDYLLSSGFSWEYLDPKNVVSIKGAHKFKVASLIYDTIPAKFPEFAPKGFAEKFSSHLEGLLGIADKILTISKTSKADIVNFCRLHKISLASRIAVVTLGCDIQSMPATGPSSKVLTRRGYFLYVSTLEVRKNHEILYRAFRRLVVERPANVPKLVFVGMPGWNVQELFEEIAKDSLISQPSVSPKLMILEKVSDSELAWLYRNAIATLFPSHYEGWGLPIAESLSVGTPVVASNAGAGVEAGQGLAVLVKPDDLEGWKSAMGAFIDKPGHRDKLVQRIKSYRPPTWEAFSESVFSELK